MTTIIERIRNNDPTLTSIDLHYENIINQDEYEYEGLTFSVEGVTDDVVILLAEALQYNTNAKEIELSENRGITSTGWIALAESLRRNTTISRLVLATANITLKTVRKFAEVLEQNQSVSILELWDNPRIGIAGITEIMKALVHNTTISELCMSTTNESTTHGSQKKLGRVLQQVMEQNTTLLEIQLGRNELRSTCMKGLANGLRINRSLQNLCLCHNSIGNIGASYLGEALQYNTALEALDISNNNIDDDGFDVIINALRYNQTLMNIDVQDNIISEAGIIAFLEILKYNNGLKCAAIRTDYTRNSDPVIGTTLQEMLQYNDTLYFIDVPAEQSSTTIELLNQNGDNVRRAPRKYYAVYDWLLQYHVVWGSTTTPLCTDQPNKKQKLS